ncbi:ABC transporter substrate-binding protein [uncultured Thiodictyon sp.]|uniref:ABC transporter substrate-binding protein n=1 Tax=uncultured Thiodictyon sp. TaxID=1846217 RepID=UPI0025DBFEAD|nr:ABC transporter substrate-binding protein [uncultured Thiodictyon sp.]
MKNRRHFLQTLTSLVVASLCAAAPALAPATPTAAKEVAQVRLAQQYGIGYLPLIVVEQNKLIEKHAKAAGLGDVEVSWTKFAGGNVMNDALLSGSLDFASGGIAPAVTLWAKTRGTKGEVKLVSALDSMPLLLNTRNPAVRTIKDFTEKDKIALPAAKVSIQAVTLQMAAEKAFGEGQQERLDPLTVSLSHPDGQTALLSGAGEISAQFSAPPFQYQQLEKPEIHTVLNSYDVLGGPSSFNVVWTTAAFREANPKLYAAVFQALAEAEQIINQDKAAASALYLRASKDKGTVADVEKIVTDPQVEFTLTPRNVTKYSDFLYKIGSIKQKPDTWKDLFFPEVHGLAGS